MKQTLFGTLLVAPVLLALAPRAERIAFSPEKGSTLVKTFTSKQELSLDDMTIKVNGADMSSQMDMGMTMVMEYSVKVSDEYAELAAGRPKALKRTYDAIASTGQFTIDSEMIPEEMRETETKATSALEGKTVLFKWSDEGSMFERSFPEGGEEKLLENLSEDMDLRVLLPDGEKAEGESWDIEVETLTTILAAGGNLSLEPEDDDSSSPFGGTGMENIDPSQMFGEDLEGEATATFKGLRDVDGAKCALISFEIKIRGSKDLTDLVRESMKDAPMPEGMPKPEIQSIDIEFKIEGEGELLWNLRGGHLHAFKLDGQIKTTLDQALTMEMQGTTMKIEQSMAMSGTLITEVEVGSD